ncbi:MAG TPA: 2-dehydro-3-deoxygalactonokinase, partial [Puia sp.]|nr:2-dehydro-3-deoxygalactonokinase [Puia sp.]
KSFLDGFKAGLDGNLLHDAFQVRTRQLLQQEKPESGYQFLSGLLIGAELGQLKNRNFPVYVVCDESLKHSYLMGLKTMKFSSGISYLNADDMLIRAHCKIAEYYS